VPDTDKSAAFPTDLPAWQALGAHYRRDMRDTRLRGLFAADQRRFAGFSLDACDLFLDYSKNLLNSSTRGLLVELAGEAGVRDAIDAMFAGDAINNTEGRSVLHVAMRSNPSDGIAS